MKELRYYLCLASLVLAGVTPAPAASGPASESVKIETAAPAQSIFRSAPNLPAAEQVLVQPPGEDDLGAA